MERTYEQDFQVRCMEVNRNGFARVESFFDYFQEVASIHAERLGVGYAMLKEYSQAWVLAKARLDLLRPLKLGDRFTLRTWPSGFKRLYATREGVLYDKSGDIARITSYWVLLDYSSMRPLRLPDSLKVPFPDNEDLPKFFDISGKAVQQPVDKSYVFTVPEHFIDINGHVNNARYCSLVGDWLANELGEPVCIKSLTAYFQHATKSGEEISIGGKYQNDGVFSIEIKSSSEVKFIAEGCFEKFS